MHKHIWQTIQPPQKVNHKDGNRYLSYDFIQICECGVYRNKEFINEKDLQNKGDGSVE